MSSFEKPAFYTDMLSTEHIEIQVKNECQVTW